jgi:hypothetical protein
MNVGFTRAALEEHTRSTKAMNRIETINDSNWQEFLASSSAVLSLSISSCPACARWRNELEQWLADDGLWPNTRFGWLTLDSPDTREFKNDNEWLDEVPGLPFNAVFVNGEPRTSLAGGGIGRLVRRLERIERETSEHPDAEFRVPRNDQPGATAPKPAR